VVDDDAHHYSPLTPSVSRPSSASRFIANKVTPLLANIGKSLLLREKNDALNRCGYNLAGQKKPRAYGPAA